MKSIKQSLTRRLSIVISLLVVSVLLITDLAVDSWIESEFNQSLRDKIGLLETLVDEDSEGVEFDFADEFFPEFSGTSEPEYFQLWYQGETFEKSATLSLYSMQTLPYYAATFEKIHIRDLTLPDGRDGRIGYATFIPQIDSDEREAFFAQQEGRPQLPMTVAYATSTEELNFALWLIDASFILALVIVPMVVRFSVRNTVAFAFQPLDNLNREIAELNVSGEKTLIKLKQPIEELNPMVQSLNSFVEQNFALYQREKRLTSDIAHELKTPISELINLVEVSLKFPGEAKLEDTLKEDVLLIATRMKEIVAGLMVLNKYRHQPLPKQDSVDVVALLQKVVQNNDSHRIDCKIQDDIDSVVCSNAFALESILTNLISNALIHSTLDSPVDVLVEAQGDRGLMVSIANQQQIPLSEDDLRYLFEPLWQKDTARTSGENFGLGLPIAAALCAAIGANIDVRLETQKIIFSLFVPKR